MTKYKYTEMVDIFSKLDIKPKGDKFIAYKFSEDQEDHVITSGQLLASICNRRHMGDDKCLGGVKATNFLIEQIDMQHGDAVQLMMSPVDEWHEVAKEILNYFGQ